MLTEADHELTRRLCRELRVVAESYIFEPNDQQTRDAIACSIGSLLRAFKIPDPHLHFAKRTYSRKSGIYEYSIVCDESNNTPDTIDLNQLVLDVAVKSSRRAEFIYIPVVIRRAV